VSGLCDISRLDCGRVDGMAQVHGTVQEADGLVLVQLYSNRCWLFVASICYFFLCELLGGFRYCSYLCRRNSNKTTGYEKDYVFIVGIIDIDNSFMLRKEATQRDSAGFGRHSPEERPVL